ncbi:hypothetical protein BH11ARM2_BH11ARM2_00390 [soil metagenome]
MEAFWLEITQDWLREIGEDPKNAPLLREAAHRRLFGIHAETFVAYPDAAPCLETLRESGMRLAVVSNWDRTLHNALAHARLRGYFEFALASLEEGVEKPDPRVFAIALDRLGLAPEEVVHVGDHLVDDIQGAASAGIRAVHLDRNGCTKGSIRSLKELPVLLRGEFDAGSLLAT